MRGGQGYFRREELLKSEAEINKLESKKKKKVDLINKTRSWFFEPK